MHSAVHDTIAAVWRIESAHIVAAVARRVRDLGVAKELAQDALMAETTIAQRIVRAKRTLADTHVPFEVRVASS